MSQKFEIPFEIAATISSDSVASSVDALQKILDTIVIEPDVDSGALEEKLNNAIGALNDVQREAAKVSLDIDTKQAIVEFNVLADMLDEISKNGLEIDIKNIGQVDAVRDSLSELTTVLSQQEIELKNIEATAGKASDEWQTLNKVFEQNKQRALQLQSVFSNIIDAGSVTKETRTVLNALDEISSRKVVPEISLDGAQKEFDLIAASLDKLSSTPLDFSSLSDGDIKSIADSFERANKAVEIQRKELEALKSTGKDGTSEYKQLAAAIKANEDALDKFNSQLPKTKEEIDNLGNSNKAINFVAFTEGAGQLEEMFGSIAEKGNEYNDALKKISAQTGLTGDALSELESQAKNAFVKGVGESAAEAVQIMGQAQTLFGQTFKGQELTDLTVSLGKTAKAFDKEFGEIATRAASFQKSFNTDGAQTGELIALALRDAKTAADDVLDTLGEYSPIVSQAGFDAAEFVGTLTRANGAFNTDKIADSIKETGIRLKEGDIQNALNDIAANLSDRVPKALLQSLNGISEAGSAGAKNVKEVLLESTQAIEQAFTEGKIDVKMRQKLQSAIAGTPAEEYGSDLYARVFGAPVDTNIIEAQAAAAQNAVSKAMKPTGVFDELQKGFEFVEAKASSLALPVAKAGTAIADMAPKFAAIKNALPESVVKKFESGLLSLAGQAVPKLGASFSSLGPMLANPWVLGTAAAVGALTYFFTSTERGQKIFQSMKEKVLEIWDAAQPTLKSLGRAFSTVGEILIEYILTPSEVVIDTITGVIDLVSELLGGGGDTGTSDIKNFFDALTVGIDAGQVALSGFLEAIKSLKDGFGSAIKSLIKGDLGGFADALGNIPDKMTGAFKDGAQKAADEIRVSKLQDTLSNALEIKGDLDKNGEIQKLIDKYNGATDDLTRQNLAQQIASQVPGAVNGITTVVDEATGKVTEIYDVSIDKAKQFADSQKKTLEAGVSSGQSAFTELLQTQVKQLDNNKAKLQEYADKIAEAQAAGKDTSELTKKYKEQEEAVQKSSEAIKSVVTQGKGLGITGDSLKTMAKNAGLSDDAANKLSGTFKKADKDVRALAVSSKVLGDAMTQALSAAQGQLDNTVNALGGATLRIKQLREQLANEKDAAKQKVLLEELNDTTTKQKELQKDIVKLAKDNVTQNQIKAYAQRLADKAAESELSRKQRAIQVAQSELEAQTKIFILEQRRKILLRGGERTIYDDIAEALKDVEEKEKILDTVGSKIGSNKGIEKYADTVKDLVAQLDSGALSLSNFSIKNIRLGVGLRVEETDQNFDLKKQIFEQVVALQESKLNVVELIVNFRKEAIEGVDSLNAIAAELAAKRFEINLSLGTIGRSEQFDELEKQLSLIEERSAYAQTSLDATQKARKEILSQLQNESLTQAKKLELQAKDAELSSAEVKLQTQLTELEIKRLDNETARRDLVRKYYDEQLSKLEQTLSITEAKSQKSLDDEKSNLETFLSQTLEMRGATIDAIKQLELDAINEVKDARLKSLDEEKQQRETIFDLIQSKQLDLSKINIDVTVGDGGNDAVLELKKKYGIINETERKFQQIRLDLQKQYDDDRAKIEADALREQAEAERRANINKQILEKRAAGESAIITAAMERKNLEIQKDSIEKRLKLAKQKADASGLKEDRDAALAIGTELDNVNKAIIEKSDLISESATAIQTSLGDVFSTLFSGSSEQIADSFRGVFATLAGALKKLASSFVIDIVLSSPWLKTAIGVNPLVGAAITGTVTGLLTGLVNAITDPVISEILSFSTGGRVDSPTIAVVGDAARLGGSNREWIFNDDQLLSVIGMSLRQQTGVLEKLFTDMLSLWNSMQFSTTLRGSDIEIAMSRNQKRKASRVREFVSVAA